MPLVALLLVLTTAQCQNQAPNSGVAPRMQVLAVEPQPNYRHSNLAQAQTSLVDGAVGRFPMWIRSGGVTWYKLTPVAIELAWRDRSPLSGTLELHAARGEYAGVFAPRRVDVYARTASGHYRYAGSREIQPTDLPDSSQAWLKARFADARGGLLLVVHAGGRFMSFDEIRIEPDLGRLRAHVDSGPQLSDLQSVRADSARRLREALRSRTCSYPRQARPAPSGFRMTALAPYGPLRPCEAPADDERLDELLGFSFETERFVLRIDNGADRARRLRVALPQLSERDYTVSRLGAVLSADGQLVLDPIKALKEPTLRLGAGETAHLWVELRMGALVAGRDQLRVHVAEPGQGSEQRLQLGTAVFPLAVAARHRMDGVPWSTLSPPVWLDSEAAQREMRSAGATVFMIPPWRNPVVVDYANTARGRRRFQRDITKLSESGLVLVQLYALRKLGGCRGDNGAAMRKRIRDLVELVAGAGVPFAAWAVYPTDEAHDASLRELLICAKAIKAEEPQIQIYANPTLSKNLSGTLQTLREMQPYVDIWQPRAALARGELLAFFQRQRTFWIYDNPRDPARSDSPNFYRSLAWRAWELGATGAGFWAFDDTRKSSAWDDFDGTRADWAVVYESQTGLVPSRRWRAFEEGLEDIAALRSIHERTELDAVRRGPDCDIAPRFAANACRERLVNTLLARKR